MAVIYLCPADKRLLCPWEGYGSDIKQHFEKEHNSLLFYTNSVEIDLDVLHENRLLCYQEEIYLIQSCISDNSKLFLRLRYLGSNVKASKIQYDLKITIGDNSYKYEPGKISCVMPTKEGWEVNLEELENLHGYLHSLTCTILFENKFDTDLVEARRKSSNTSLRLNNIFVEKNAIDEAEIKILDDISLVDERIKELKKKQREENTTEKEKQREENTTEKEKQKEEDIMDKISVLNFSMLEEPFSGNKKEEHKNDLFQDQLPDIPEKLNLSCSSCRLDMLPPIYLCVNGHNVCSQCRSRPCEKCNGPVTITRNTNLENISRTHKHPCRYSSDGCNEKLLYNELRSHEARCPFCKYKCALTDCVYEGKFDHFLHHLNVHHSSIRVNLTVRAEFPKNSEFYIVNRAVGVFYCKSEQENVDLLNWKAVFCGPKERQFFCELFFKGSKYKEAIFMKRRDNVFQVDKSVTEMKKMKAKDKYAVLTITSYDS